ncbi:MAG: DUF502 domain-containing protein [Phycisphaera sp.]|nr:DUF502 domain-containing protein [Phycisphaera sp.]
MVKQAGLGFNFRRFFFRGLAILLPSILTVWVLIAAYNFVQTRIAGPINVGVRELIVYTSPWPKVLESDIQSHREVIEKNPDLRAQWRSAQDSRQWLERDTRRQVLAQKWSDYSYALDLIGLVIAVLAIYIAGAFLGSFIGGRIWARGEELIGRVPLIKQVYPSIKQVTDFIVGGGGDDQEIRFNRVVAVQYPRKGIWSVGLVTGDTMRLIQEAAGQECITVFVPSSPTPFTGYVITVSREDAIDLPVSIEEALRFTISGGVVVPPSQLVNRSSDNVGMKSIPAGSVRKLGPSGEDQAKAS